jgi:PAS domain-containing protein
MNKNNMTKRLLLPFSLALFALLITSVAIIYWQQFKNINEEIISHTQKVQQLFKMKLDEDAKILESQINLLRLNKDLHKSYKNQDRKALLKYAMPFFNILNNKYQITHFYFINLDKICFLRVHNPKRYGDSIPRFTLTEAIDNNAPAYGIELGKFGTFTLRFVYPWYVDGKLIGYLELGKEIEHITVAIKEILNVELLFTINKSFLNRPDWEEGSRMMERNGDWNLFSDIVVIDKTIPVIQEVKKMIEEISLHSTREHFRTHTKFTFNNKRYNSMPIPLTDAGNRELGDIIVLIDISEHEMVLRTLLIVLITISIVISAGLLRFFYMFIKGVETELVKAHDELILAEKMKAQQDKLIADKAMRITQALDRATTSILITDSHYDVIYLNKAAQQLFTKYESIIQKHIHHFEAKRILGSSLAWCHKDSYAHKLQILENINGSHRTRINVGEMVLDHITTPVTNDDEHIGTIIELNDRTVEIAIEKEINTVIQAASVGDFRHRISLENKEGFFELFATRVNEIMDFNQSAIEDIMHIISALAKGDLTQKIENDYVGAFDRLKNDINITVTKLTEVITAMLQTAKIVNSIADEISQGNFNLTRYGASCKSSKKSLVDTLWCY